MPYYELALLSHSLGKWWFTAHGEKFDFSGLADGSVDKYTVSIFYFFFRTMLRFPSLQFEDVHGAVENRIEDKMGSFALSSRFGFTDTENIEAVYENAVTNLISDQYAHAVYPAGHVSGSFITTFALRPRALGHNRSFFVQLSSVLLVLRTHPFFMIASHGASPHSAS